MFWFTYKQWEFLHRLMQLEIYIYLLARKQSKNMYGKWIKYENIFSFPFRVDDFKEFLKNLPDKIHKNILLIPFTPDTDFTNYITESFWQPEMLAGWETAEVSTCCPVRLKPVGQQPANI